MKIKFEEKRFRGDTRKLLDSLISIVDAYQQQGYRMTLRQLYYQLVARGIIPNEQRLYDKLSRVLTDARMAGLVDWDFIEDRIRTPKFPNEFSDVHSLVQTAISVYRRPRWADQPFYVEVWVEKDALSGVLLPLTDEYHVRLLVNRGYSSATAMFDAAERFKRAACLGKRCILIYLGDHDPSGEDMVRDIRDRLTSFRANVDVRKIALTRQQIDQYNPPPNPAKMSDTRADKYVKTHGEHSWELDALPPDVLIELAKVSLDQVIDRSKYDAVLEQEQADKLRLTSLVEENQGFSEGK